MIDQFGQEFNRDQVKDVVYGVAGELTQMTMIRFFGNGSDFYDLHWTETRQYNVRLQMTRMTVAGVTDLEYRYSAAQNNGKITSMKNYVSGEEVSYQYDELQRLIRAVTTGPEWGLSFGYDGFNRAAVAVRSAPGSCWPVLGRGPTAG